MAVPFGPVAGESKSDALRLSFDRRIKLHFHGAKLSSDGGLLLFRELDDALGLTEMASWELRDRRTGRNTQHTLLALFRQSVFGRLAGYEDVNDADRLSRDPVMRSIVGRGADYRAAASESEMGYFEDLDSERGIVYDIRKIADQKCGVLQGLDFTHRVLSQTLTEGVPWLSSNVPRKGG